MSSGMGSGGVAITEEGRYALDEAVGEYGVMLDQG